MLVAAASVISGSVLLAIFYIRNRFKKPIYLLCGSLLVVLGTASLFMLSGKIFGTGISAQFCYIGSFVALCVGVEFILLYGFNSEGQREAFLLDCAPELDQTEWNRLESIAGSMLNIRRQADLIAQSSQPALSDAILQSSTIVEAAMERRLGEMGKGTFYVRGEQMIDVFAKFAAALGKEHRFRAVSYDDFDYWTSNESKPYLKINAGLADAGSANKVTAQRIFVLRKSYNLSANDLLGINKNFEANVAIAFMREDHLDHTLLSSDNHKDFALFGDFALSTWMRSDGRLFRVSINADSIRRQQRTFAIFEDHCLQSKSSTSPYFKSMEDFKKSSVYSDIVSPAVVVNGTENAAAEPTGSGRAEHVTS
jgi:hypothetical protein